MCGEKRAQEQLPTGIPAPKETDKHQSNTESIASLTWKQKIVVRYRWCCGLMLLANFAIFWAIPIVVQGRVWKKGLCVPMRRLFYFIDNSPTLRRFAVRYIYGKEVYADFFAISLLFLIQVSSFVGLVFYWQIKYDTLPWWLIYTYYFQWVGLGGRAMGSAYVFAHKESHHRGGGMYKPWIAKTFGNFWENWIGLIYGNVPNNFSTSHVFLHHRLNGGKGDTFYQFDLNRSSWSDLLLFLYRIFVHMTGISSLRIFRDMSEDGNKIMRDNYYALRRGMIIYWLAVPTAIATILAAAGCTPGGIASFLFFIYLEPLFCMTFFLAYINFALHGFVEFDPAGRHIPCVQSTLIIDGEDDFFGEDDHMAHHYHGHVTHRDLKEHQRKQVEEWARHKASVFRRIVIVELTTLMLLKQWGRIAERFVDHSGTLSPAAAAALLESRAQRKEMTYAEYEFSYLPSLRRRAAALVAQGVCTSLEQAYKHIAHHK